MVDGFMIARKFREQCPEGYEFLKSTPLAAEYIHKTSLPHQHFYNNDVVFKHDPDDDSSLMQFRFNVNDRAPHRMDLDQQRKFYKYYPELSKLVNDPENIYWTELEPGRVLIVNNWRVMHGRAEFVGKRTLSVCYVGREDYMSKAKTFGLV